MSFDLKSSVVRILTPAGETAGTGFLVASDGLIFTCFHVISYTDDVPESVHCQFLSDPEGRLIEAVVLKDHCRLQSMGDVAVLKVAQVPEQAAVAELISYKKQVDATFDAYGFPDANTEQGMWAKGKIGKAVGTDNNLIQLHKASAITKGYSGGPAVLKDTNKIVGMVCLMTRTDAHGKQSEEAFAIPSEYLASVCSLVKLAADTAPAKRKKAFDGSFIPEEWNIRSNRDSQLTTFESEVTSQYFHGTAHPRIYFTLGHNEDRHKSLVVRFKEESIAWVVEELDGGSVVRKFAGLLPFNVGLDARKQVLKQRLVKDNFPGLNPVELDARQLLGYEKYRQNDAVVIQHDVQTKDWDDTSCKLLDWYCNEFWNVEQTKSARYIICICLVYSKSENKGGLFSRLFGGKANIQEKVLSDLKKIVGDNNQHVTILNELGPVSVEDVEAWANACNERVAEFDVSTDNIFEGETELPMQTMESKLAKEIKAFNQKQNNQLNQ